MSDIQGQRRTTDLEAHGWKYEHFDPHGGRCIYCGEHGNEQDHIPPISQAHRFEYTAEPLEFILVPACGECNRALGAALINDLALRRRFLYDRYSTKYSELLGAPEWSEEELDKMGPGMKTHILDRGTKMKIVNRRLYMLREGETIEEYKRMCL